MTGPIPKEFKSQDQQKNEATKLGMKRNLSFKVHALSLFLQTARP
jgi:hypothetical protein